MSSLVSNLEAADDFFTPLVLDSSLTSGLVESRETVLLSFRAAYEYLDTAGLLVDKRDTVLVCFNWGALRDTGFVTVATELRAVPNVGCFGSALPVPMLALVVMALLSFAVLILLLARPPNFSFGTATGPFSSLVVGLLIKPGFAACFFSSSCFLVVVVLAVSGWGLAMAVDGL